MAIRRNIEVTRKGLDVSIDVTYGTGLIPIELNITDYQIPKGAAVIVYSEGASKKVKKDTCSIDNNTIVFSPIVGFFEVGKNDLQVRVVYDNKSLFSFKCKVNCHGTYRDDDATEVEEQPTLVEQLISENSKLSEMVKSLSNPNLLINGDFQVNQRGKTNYPIASSCSEYTVDRWVKQKLLDLTVNDGYISLVNTNSSQTYLRQILEDSKKLFKETLTLSVKYRNAIGQTSVFIGQHNTLSDNDRIDANTNIILDDNGSEWKTKSITLDLSKFSITRNYLNVTFRLEANSSVDIAWVKLEQGSIATPFVPRSYGEELMLCQRYYYVLKYSQYVATVDGSGNLYIHSDWVLNHMRENKTIEINNFYNIQIYQNGGISAQSIRLGGFNFAYGAIGFRPQDIAETLSVGTAYVYATDTSQYLAIDAEIY